ncbi:MAG: transposase [Gemmataceae bacterium]
MKKWLPRQQVKLIAPYIPQHCEACERALSSEPGLHDPAPTLHQIAELPSVLVEVTDHQGHSRTCSCGHIIHASIPAAIRAHSLGSQLTAALIYFSGCHGMSKRSIEETVETLFGVPITIGTIANREREVSEALEPAYRVVRLSNDCRRLSERYPMLWLFAAVEGVEPTNNHAERVQRRAALWRRKSFGCQSQTGCRFVERILTVIQTLRLQKRNAIAYLGHVVANQQMRLGTPAMCGIG